MVRCAATIANPFLYELTRFADKYVNADSMSMLNLSRRRRGRHGNGSNNWRIHLRLGSLCRQNYGRMQRDWERTWVLMRLKLVSDSRVYWDGPCLQRFFTEPTTHIDNEYSRAGIQDPKIIITTSRDPSSKLLQFAKVRGLELWSV